MAESPICRVYGGAELAPKPAPPMLIVSYAHCARCNRYARDIRGPSFRLPRPGWSRGAQRCSLPIALGEPQSHWLRQRHGPVPRKTEAQLRVNLPFVHIRVGFFLLAEVTCKYDNTRENCYILGSTCGSDGHFSQQLLLVVIFKFWPSAVWACSLSRLAEAVNKACQESRFQWTTALSIRLGAFRLARPRKSRQDW
eukprot:5995120-Amphidinium_carterae.1